MTHMACFYVRRNRISKRVAKLSAGSPRSDSEYRQAYCLSRVSLATFAAAAIVTTTNISLLRRTRATDKHTWGFVAPGAGPSSQQVLRQHKSKGLFSMKAAARTGIRRHAVEDVSSQLTRARQIASVSELPPLEQGDLFLNLLVFLAFCIPFFAAAKEFWQRIAFGQQFGTGDDPVVFPRPDGKELPDAPKQQRRIGKDGKVTIGMDADTNRGRRVLTEDALNFAYFLMFLCGASIMGALAGAYMAISGPATVV